MSRLTDKDSYCFMSCADDYCGTESIGEDCKLYKACFERKMYDKLKHYEDLEETGRLIKLPCKVGTDTYCILARYNFKRRESEYYIEVFHFEADMLNGLGEKFFLTKAEAEAKLAELKGGAE